jgi:hypothetical protein
LSTHLIQELNSDGIYDIVTYTPPGGSDKVVHLHAQTPPFEMFLRWRSGKPMLAVAKVFWRK